VRQLSVNQTAGIISTYTGDTSGVCSALFELGGMTVMHDASGCNSTYNTHDEPRWYDRDSLVFISGLTETEAMLGDDSKLIADTVAAAKDLKPFFIALAGSPIPMLTGVDFPAIARQIEKATGITTFGFPTDGMHSYVHGASMAFAALAERFCRETIAKSTELTANILGVTPLDFSINGSAEAMGTALTKRGIKVKAQWAMGKYIKPEALLESLAASGEASVNLVVSACGLKAAQVLNRRFGTPYVIGTPYGDLFTDELAKALAESAATGSNKILCPSRTNASTVIIGESVTALSLANALFYTTGSGATVLCPVDSAPELLGEGCLQAWDEDDLIPHLQRANCIIADPLYKPICPPQAKFIALPHEAFSGRLYRKQIPELVSEWQKFTAHIIERNV